MREAAELDPEALHRYLSFLWCPGEGTPLKQVRKVLPGEAMMVRKGRIVRRWIWYQLPVFQDGVRALDEAQSVSGTVHHLRQAVHRQMVSDVPLGAFLSGGLDSSAVVTFAREQNPDIRCFTIEVIGGQEAGATDDLLSAESLTRRGLFEPMAVQRLIAANDEGRVDASYTLLSLLCIEIWFVWSLWFIWFVWSLWSAGKARRLRSLRPSRVQSGVDGRAMHRGAAEVRTEAYRFLNAERVSACD